MEPAPPIPEPPDPPPIREAGLLLVLPPMDRLPNVPDELFDPISCAQTVVWLPSTQNTTIIAAANWTRMVTSPGKGLENYRLENYRYRYCYIVRKSSGIANSIPSR